MPTRKAIDLASEIADRLWVKLGEDEFDRLSVSELEELLNFVERFHRAFLPLIDKSETLNQLHFDCQLIKSFIIAEQNYSVTGSFIKI